MNLNTPIANAISRHCHCCVEADQTIPHEVVSADDFRELENILKNFVIYEDQLPPNISRSDYADWHAKSFVLFGVRMGPRYDWSCGRKNCWMLKDGYCPRCHEGAYP